MRLLSVPSPHLHRSTTSAQCTNIFTLFTRTVILDALIIVICQWIFVLNRIPFSLNIYVEYTVHSISYRTFHFPVLR